MRACIHRGSKEIGGSCIEVEQSGQRILLDLGLPLDAEFNTPRFLPPVRGLDGSDPSLLGILISHPHLDHYGLLAHVSPAVKVGLGASARRVLRAASDFVPGEWPLPNAGWDYRSGKSFDVGPFRVTPYLVDHSAYDAHALLIESGGKRLFYSGDFRGHGRKSALFERMVADAPRDIDALLVEGSSLSRLDANGTFPTESDVETQFADAFHQTHGLALVHHFRSECRSNRLHLSRCEADRPDTGHRPLCCSRSGGDRKHQPSSIPLGQRGVICTAHAAATHQEIFPLRSTFQTFAQPRVRTRSERRS